MSAGARSGVDATTTDVAGLNNEDFSTAQEDVPVPYLAGEFQAAGRWITPIYKQHAVPAPATSAKK